MLSRARLFQLNAFHVLIDGLFDSVPLLLAFMVVAFGGAEKEVGSIVSLGVLASTLAGLATVGFSRRHGFPRTVSLVALCYGVGFAANGFAEGIVHTGFFFVVAVAGHGIFHNVSFSYLTAHSERRVLGKVMSDFTAIGDVGRIPLASFAAFAAALTVSGLPGWRFVCWLYGGLALAAAFAALRMASREEREVPRASGTEGSKHRLLPSFSLLRDRSLALALVGSGLNAFSGDQVFAFLPLLLFAKGIDPKIMGSFAPGFTVGCFAGKMLCGRLVDRFGTRRIFLFASILTALMLVVMATAREFWLVIVAALLLGIVTKGTVPVIQVIVTEPVRDAEHYDDVFSLNGFARGVINILTPLCFGFAASFWGIERIYMLMAVGAVLAIVPVCLMGKKDG